MNKIVLCPGKIPIKNKEQPWYLPIGNNYPENCVICECCYKNYNKYLYPVCFKIVHGDKYFCWCNLRTFDKSSICINNIRVSVINPTNFYRYRIVKRKDKINFCIPKNGKYIVIAENMENCNINLSHNCVQEDVHNTKISVDIVLSNDTESRYYDKKYPNYLIIDNSEDCLVYNNPCVNGCFVNFIIKKWTKLNDPEMKKYYSLVDNGETEFEFQLIFNDTEYKNMENAIELNKNLSINTNKSIFIENFII